LSFEFFKMLGRSRATTRGQPVVQRTGPHATALFGRSSRTGCLSTTKRAALKMCFGVQFWVFSIRLVEVKRFQASAPLAGLMFPAGPRFSSG
jgi:hypothetical protein